MVIHKPNLWAKSLPWSVERTRVAANLRWKLPTLFSHTAANAATALPSMKEAENNTQPSLNNAEDSTESLSRLHAVVQGLDDKKADKITILDLEDRSSVARYYVIATGTSDAHLNAMRGNLEDIWKDRFGEKIETDAAKGSGWYVLDSHDTLVHLFTAQQREHYNLEELWGDAKTLNTESFTKDIPSR